MQIFLLRTSLALLPLGTAAVVERAQVVTVKFWLVEHLINFIVNEASPSRCGLP